MPQCPLCALSFQNDEGLGNHKSKEHKKGEKVPTLAQTSVQLIREQAIAHEKGEDASFGFGVGDPVAAGGEEAKKKQEEKKKEQEKEELLAKTTTTTTTTAPKK